MAALTWFRRNLRLTANSAVTAASAHPEQYFVFCLDKQYTGAWLGIPRSGPHRMRLLQESLQQLQQELKSRGANLLVIQGEPEKVLPGLAEQLGCQVVETQALPAWEEQRQQQQVKAALAARQVALRLHDDYTLFQPQQVKQWLARPLTSFSAFRKKVEPQLPELIEPLSQQANLQPPGHFYSPKSTPAGVVQIPGATSATLDSRTAWPFTGGAIAGQQRLEHYLQAAGPVRHYHETRNELLGTEYSSKLSPWLNLGCLSPAATLIAIHEHEQSYGANKSTYWLQFELLWREFFQHLARQQGAALFQGQPARASVKHWQAGFSNWCRGTTGHPFVDANMRELQATGYLSNRGRQNVASACIHELGIDWRLGAAWFESQLLDFDPASNYGNWQYIAGLAASTRGGSWFNLDSQANRYDPDSAYADHWLSMPV